MASKLFSAMKIPMEDWKRFFPTCPTGKRLKRNYVQHATFAITGTASSVAVSCGVKKGKTGTARWSAMCHHFLPIYNMDWDWIASSGKML